MAEIPNVDQLRHGIDHGMTGDKVDFPDPAAAPLGTDAEAGGHAPTPLELRIEARAAGKILRQPKGDSGLTLFLCAAGGFGLIALIVVYLAR